MSRLQYELIQATNGLSDVSIKKLIDYVHTHIVPFDSFTQKAEYNSLSPVSSAQINANRLGSRKGVKFVAEGHDIDDFNDEIEQLFGESN